MKLNVKALGLSIGIVWAAAILLATLWIIVIGGEGKTLMKLSNFYFGYSVSIIGAIVGMVWGFIDGFIAGVLIAWLYNKVAIAEPQS